jgi:hypothetical protein
MKMVSNDLSKTLKYYIVNFNRIKNIKMAVSALPTASFPIGIADLPLRQKSGYHENIEVSRNVCQSR